MWRVATFHTEGRLQTVEINVDTWRKISMMFFNCERWWVNFHCVWTRQTPLRQCYLRYTITLARNVGHNARTKNCENICFPWECRRLGCCSPFVPWRWPPVEGRFSGCWHGACPHLSVLVALMHLFVISAHFLLLLLEPRWWWHGFCLPTAHVGYFVIVGFYQSIDSRLDTHSSESPYKISK